MRNNIIIILVLLLLLFGCKREDMLPKSTEEGSNTFGCLVNGKVWTPKGRIGTLSNLNVRLNNDNFFSLNTFRVSGNEEEEYMNIYITDLELNYVGTFDLSIPENAAANFQTSKGCTYNEYDNSVNRSGTLNITRFDSGIIAGTFEFTLEKPDCETIHVREGRFDLRF